MSKNVTQLLQKWSESGDRTVLDELLPLVYKELKRIAVNYLQKEDGSHTLQPTALVHEAYLRLVDQNVYGFENRTQFFALAAKMMRNVLVNHAEAKRAAKRGGKLNKVDFEETILAFPELNLDILALDEALKQLMSIDETKSHIVELKFFGGLTTSEIARTMKLSTATIEREWAFSRAWLHQKMQV